MSVLGYSLDRFDTDRPGPFYNSGTYPHRFTAGAAKILSKTGIPCQIVSVLVDQKDANTTLNIYEGSNSSGTLIASIVLSKLGTIPMFITTSKGVYVSCAGGAGSAVIVTDAATYNSALLTMPGNEISDAVRSASTQGDGRAPPDSSYGVWETTTNLLKNGGAEVDTSHTGAVVGSGATITRDTSVHKFGSACFKVVLDGSNQNGIFWHSDAGPGTNRITVTTGQAYTFSIWAKGNAGGETMLLAIPWFDSSNSSLSTTEVSLTLTTTLTKYTVTGTAPASAVLAVGRLRTSAAASVTFFSDGAQFENKSYATPYVETTTAAASRSTMRIQAPPGLFNSTQGWFAMCFRIGLSNTDIGNKSTGEAHLFTVTDGTRGITSYLNASGNLVLARDQGSGSSGTSQAVTGGTISRGDTIVAVVAWTATAISVSVNGANFGSAANTPAAFTALTGADIGEVGTGRELDGDIFWAATGTGTLSNTDAATINGFGSTDHLLTEFPGACTFFWPADTSRYYTP